MVIVSELYIDSALLHTTKMFSLNNVLQEISNEN